MILFAETRGFTRMSEILQPSVVLARISEFFDMVSAAVKRHEGAVLNVFNDTLAATFTGQDYAEHAARTAQEICQEFGPVAEAWEGDYALHAAVAMGLHCGEIVVGPAGDSLPGQRLVIGDSVSIAERLLHRARAGEYVLSHAFMEALAATQFPLDAVELPALKIPSRAPIRIFGVLIDTRLDFT
jgi:class 3 adenylate cyclase